MLSKRTHPRASTPRISLAEIVGEDDYAQVEIVSMTAKHAKWWHQKVQPIIDNSYRNSTGGDLNKKIRADRGWNWTRYLRYVTLHNIGHPGTWIGAHAIGLTMEAINRRGERIPVGMLTFVPSYLCNSDHLGRKTYLWFVSSAPKEVYHHFLDGDVLEGVAKALFDAAIIESYKSKLNGALLLHSSPDGGETLQGIYYKLGFRQVKNSFGPITLVRWEDRTEYMLLSAERASEMIEKNNCYRT